MSNGHNILEMDEAIPHRGDAPTLWRFQFGQAGATDVFVWGGYVEGGLEEAAGWLKDNAPGHLSEPDYEGAAKDLDITWPSTDETLYEDSVKVNYERIRGAARFRGAPIVVVDHTSAAVALDWLLANRYDDVQYLEPSEENLENAMREQAEADMTYTESGWLTSDEWFVNEQHLGDEMVPSYAEIWEMVIDELAEDGRLDDYALEEVNAFAAENNIDAGWVAD